MVGQSQKELVFLNFIVYRRMGEPFWAVLIYEIQIDVYMVLLPAATLHESK